MKKPVFYLLLIFIFAATSCSLLDGLEGDDPPCDSVAPIDDRIRNAVPYQTGQVLRFEASDGTSFMTTVEERTFDPTQISGCEEEISFDFGGVNVNNSLEVEIRLLGDNTELDFRIDFNVNGFGGNSHRVNLNAAGEVVSGSSFSRVIADTILNGQRFLDVGAVDHTYLNNPPIRESYYNLAAGFIGVELIDGTTVFLRE